jgi:Holliday junction resolvase-like predicted endonuclease
MDLYSQLQAQKVESINSQKAQKLL